MGLEASRSARRPLAAVALWALGLAAAQAEPCALAREGETVAVERVVDGDMLILDDGRTVRLAGIEAPKAPLGKTPAEWPLEEASRRALEQAAAGQVLELRAAVASPDRRGRVLGYLAGLGEADHAEISSMLLAKGLARVAADAAGRDCRATLASAESAAVVSRLGLWSEPYYEVRSATDGAAFADLDGRFVVAEGRVASARVSAGRACVNFGRRWRGALSLTLSEATLRRLGGFEALGTTAGATIRARGVVEMRGGPMIRVTEAAQIERVSAQPRGSKK